MRTPKNLKRVQKSFGNFIGKLRAVSSGPNSAKSSTKSSRVFHFDFPEELTTPRAEVPISPEKDSQKTAASGESDIDFVAFVRSVSTSPSVRERRGSNEEDELGLDRYDSMYPEEDAEEAWDNTSPAPLSPAGSLSSVVPLANASLVSKEGDVKPLPSPSGIVSHFSSESDGDTAPTPSVLSSGSLTEAPIPVLQSPPIQSGMKTMNPTTPTSLTADAEVNWSARSKKEQVHVRACP